MKRICKINLLILVSGILFIPTISRADVYRAVDEYGQVIFTDKPLNDSYIKLIKTWKGWQPQNPYSERYQNMKRNRAKYLSIIRAAAKRYQLPEPLIHAVITAESAYDTEAVSRAGAVGLMQLMLATAERYGVKNRRNPYQNVNGGVQYLRDLLALFNNDLKLAIAAYNAGENAVKKYNNKIPPYKETQHYVKKVLAYYKDYKTQF